MEVFMAELKILQKVRETLQSPNKTDQEKASAALVAALEVLEKLQSLETRNPKLFERVKKELEGESKKTAKIKDLQP